MRRLASFLVVTADGYYEGPNRELDWPFVNDEFGIRQLDAADILVFGRHTYQTMGRYWPTPQAQQNDPDVAFRMNSLTKVVVLLTTSLIRTGLLDELRIMLNPIVLGAGNSVFRSSGRRLGLELTSAQPFKSGNVLLRYRPVGPEPGAREVEWQEIQLHPVAERPASGTMGVMQSPAITLARGELDAQLEHHRAALTAYCYRMLGSPFEAEDAVQETFLRAWRALERFEGRSALGSWLYRIATNVCLDMLEGRARRAMPMDLGAASPPDAARRNTRPETTWLQPIPQSLIATDGDPADVAVERETVRLAFVAALQHLPPRQRAVLILCEVLSWKAKEVAELLDTSVASVNSALQRARATLAASGVSANDPMPAVDDAQRQLLARYVDAFERYDMKALTSLIREDAGQSMPPYDMWLQGRDDIFTWWLGPGAGCRDSRLVPVMANGVLAFGQYKPSTTGPGRDPWALQVLDIREGRIGELTFFLDTERLFPLFGLPSHLD